MFLYFTLFRARKDAMYDMNNPFFDEVTGYQLKALDPEEDMNIVAVPMANYDDELGTLGK